MNIFVFVLAAVLSMPKQFITVYIGTLLESSANGKLPVHFRNVILIPEQVLPQLRTKFSVTSSVASLLS